MTDNVDDLILEMLKGLRNDVRAQGGKMDAQFEQVRLRLGSIQTQLASPQREVAGLHGDIAIVRGRIDGVEGLLNLNQTPVLSTGGDWSAFRDTYVRGGSGGNARQAFGIALHLAVVGADPRPPPGPARRVPATV